MRRLSFGTRRDITAAPIWRLRATAAIVVSESHSSAVSVPTLVAEQLVVRIVSLIVAPTNPAQCGWLGGMLSSYYREAA